MKNIWKFMMIAVMAIAMVGCPDPNKGNNEGDNGESGPKKIFVAGFNGLWAKDNDKGDALQMTTTDGKVYTLEAKASSKNPTPYGFKFTSNKGWAEQWVLASAMANPGVKQAEVKKFVESDETCDFVLADKATLEAKDGDDALIPDNNTKIFIKYFVNDQSDVKITFDLENLKASIHYTAKDDPGIEVTNIMVDGLLPVLPSNVGAFDVVLDEDNSNPDSGLYIWTATKVYKSSDDTWQKDAGTVEFGICVDANWTQKFVEGTFDVGTTSDFVNVTYDVGSNNKITGLQDNDKVVVTIKAQATASGKWSDCAISFKVDIAND